MKNKENQKQESDIQFADIPQYLVEEIGDLEREIRQETGKTVMLVAYEAKEG